MKKFMSIALLALLGFTASTNAFLFWGRGRGDCCGGYGYGGYPYSGSGYGSNCCGNDRCCDGYGYGSGYWW